MVLRLAILPLLGCLVVAGPVSWDDSKCAQKCHGGGKYQYSEGTSYIYSFESTNEMYADGASDLSMNMVASVKIIALSKCEMVLQISEVTLKHGPIKETSSSFIEQLKRNPLPFSFDDGNIEHVCPNPDDSESVNNIKKAILSAFKNSMKSFETNSYEKEVDILGSCDTEYKVESNKNDRVAITKKKLIPTCTNHIKGQTLLIASFYESSSNRQHLPFLSGESLSCQQVITGGIVEEVSCEEKADFKPLAEYGYVVQTVGRISLKKISTETASRIQYRAPTKESLVFKHTPHANKDGNLKEEAESILRNICEKTEGIISKNAAHSIHRLVYVIRGMDTESLTNIYTSLKNKNLCQNHKTLTIYLDALKAASSGGSIGLLSKLATNGELRILDTMLWMTVLPFTSYIEEESISAAIPLLKKESARKQALLGVSAMAYKYCSTHENCETSNAIKDLSSNLKQFLGDKCQTSDREEESKIVTALKAFGNLGYVGDSAENIFECATLSSNKVSVRIAAIEAFRRSPTSESVSTKLMDIYKNKNEDDEIRIAALISLLRFPTPEIVKQVVEVYYSENSKQVEVFTWSYLNNMHSSSDPLKSKIQKYLSWLNIKAPQSMDITKFSRNYESSLFSDFLNIGHSVEGNIIHSKKSFLPRSADLGLKANILGNQLDLLQTGVRIEDLEHILEKLFGPHGLMPNFKLQDLLAEVNEKYRSRGKRSSELPESKIEALTERFGFSRGKIPHGSAYIRVLGHELSWSDIHKDIFEKYKELDVKNILKELATTNLYDRARNLLFIDLSVLFPSVTGRAYKLASNGSLTVALKAEGKMDLQQLNLPHPRADIDGRMQPSILSDLTASFTIHSEKFEPGVKVETTLNAGLDFDAKIELQSGQNLRTHIKLKRKQDKQEIANLKRTISTMNHLGVIEHPKPPSYNLNYCTKYVQHILGVRYCASGSIPHFYNAEGKPKVPFVRALEASLSVEKTDTNMDGYEFIFQVPLSLKEPERKYIFLLDTPNSAIDRKLSLDLLVNEPNAENKKINLKVYNPLYTLNVNADIVNRADRLKIDAEALADGKRSYKMALDVEKDIKGARLIEYQPKLSLTIPNVRPIDISGTIVFAKGSKEQITVNLQSSSFETPITVKGLLSKHAKDGISLDADWKLNSELNVTAFSKVHKLASSIGNKAGNGVFLDLSHHYEPDGRGYESVTVNAKLENIELRDQLKFSLETLVLLAEHEDLNSNFRWDFSFKPLEHLKSDVLFRYGKNFDDEKNLVRITHMTALSGDFDTFQRLDIENKLGLTISCFDFDKSAALSIEYDFIDQPKFSIEAGVKSSKDREMSLKYDYTHVVSNPLQLSSKARIVYYDFIILYHNDLQEISPGEYHGKAVVENAHNKQVKIDYVYRSKTQGNTVHREYEGTVDFPGRADPVKITATMACSKDSFKLHSVADPGNQTPYSIDIKLERTGSNQIALSTPYIEGSVMVDFENNVYSISADVTSKVNEDKRVKLTGTLTTGVINTLTMDISYESDKDSKKEISIKAKSNHGTEEGIEKHMITATINYVGSINVEVTGKVSTDMIKGPHYFRADFSGNMEPMAIEYTHEIKDGHVSSVAKYLRNNSEKLKLDMKAKFIMTGSKFETEAGMFMSSPYKTFDGKEIYFRIMADSSETTRTFVGEYKIKPAAVIGYVVKLDYNRKRGFPGHMRSNLLVSVHQRPIYEGSTHLDYGNGRYVWKTSFSPASKKKISLTSSFEHSAKFAAFHHSMNSALQYLQKIELHAIADLRNKENSTLNSGLTVNEHKMYDVNSTLKMRSVIDFDWEMLLFSRITPSVHIFSKAQTTSGERSVTRYDVNLDVDSNTLFTGSGELKKRKKSFNSDFSFSYKDSEFLVMSIIQEAKSQRERNYNIKVITPWRNYTSTIRVNKEKKGSVKYDTKFCRLNDDKCIVVDVTHKEHDETNEWQIDYKRGDVEFSIERIRVSSKEHSRYHTVLYKGDKRYGYDLRLAKEGKGHSISLGIIIPSREVISKTYAEFSFEKPRIKFEFSADGKKHPDRKLITDFKFENHLADNNPSKLDITISHPIYEKPIELKLIGDLEITSSKFFTAEASLDYSSNPEDKLIAKLSMEKLKDHSGTGILKIYHQDDQHLDFTMKGNASFSDNEDYMGFFTTWKDDSDVEQTAFMELHAKGDVFHFELNRPKFVCRLDGSVVSPNSLLGQTREVDLDFNYNGQKTKAKFIADYSNGCYQLLILNNEGETTRKLELCLIDGNRKLVSASMESLDDEGQWQLDYSFDVVRKSWRTINSRHYINPEFSGTFLYKMTSLGEELTAAGIGSPPFYNTTRFKKIRSAFHSKIFQPSVRFFIPEAAKFIGDIRRDSLFLSLKLRDYYHTLPPFVEVKQKVEKIRAWLRGALKEAWSNIESYYNELFKDIIKFTNKATVIVSSICNKNDECKNLVKAFKEDGIHGLCNQIKLILLALPGKIEDFINSSNVDARKFFDKAMVIVKAGLRPLAKYRCGKIFTKIVQLSYERLEPKIQKFLENYPRYYRNAKETLTTNPHIQKMVKITKDIYLRIRERFRMIDYKKIFSLVKKHAEDYLFQMSPPNPGRSFTINSMNFEKGIVDYDLHFGVSQSLPIRTLRLIITPIMEAISTLLSEYNPYNVNTALVKIKRVLDMNFFPPYEAEAMIIDNKHFITFDKTFYDFEGECTHLLSKDFEDGNFTFVLKPKEGEKDHSILSVINDVNIVLNSAQRTVSVAGNEVELPYVASDFVISRLGETVILDDKHGVKVKCNLQHNICMFQINGFYFGKTAGLLGTYNYEKYDEFKRPKGQIANTATVHAKSWEAQKGCKSNNLIPDIKINENSDYYKICKAHFEDGSSPLAACFNEVKPDSYFDLCLRYLARADDKNKALCKVATAYVTICERNYIEINLPSKCLTCIAPDGIELQHGDRKKYLNLKKKSADVVFIVEDNECNNNVVNDLGNLARSIDRELQNEGFKDTVFGVVGYGGLVGKPEIYTVKQKTLFNSRDISSIKDRFKLEGTKEDSRAFEAIKLAVTYLFRTETSKSIVLLSCSSCKYDYKSLQYPVVQQILLERGITLHVIQPAEISLRKYAHKANDIIGVDPDTVYHSKDVTQKDLTGDPSLRSYVSLPKDLCVALAQDVGGSYFSSSSLGKAQSEKNWRNVFSRKFLKSISTSECQWCDCTSSSDHTPKTVCQPCETKRPRLPFSVCRYCVLPRTVESFFSYIRQIIRMK